MGPPGLRRRHSLLLMLFLLPYIMLYDVLTAVCCYCWMMYAARCIQLLQLHATYTVAGQAIISNFVVSWKLGESHLYHVALLRLQGKATGHKEEGQGGFNMDGVFV